jgi:hypothetical protein
VILAFVVAVGCAKSDAPSSASSAKEAAIQKRRTLAQAVEEGDLVAVRNLLQGGMKPDGSPGTNRTPLAIAAQLLSEASKSQYTNREAVFLELCHSLRRTHGQIVEVVGNVGITTTIGGLGSDGKIQVIVEARIEGSGGRSHPLELSFYETAYHNMTASKGGCFLPSKGSYRVRGCLLQDTLEVEEIELQRDSSGKGGALDAEGVLFPISPWLPSTHKVFAELTPRNR